MQITQEVFRNFITQSGLTKKFIASNVINVKPWVIAKWLAGGTVLFPYQQRKLNEFCTAFCENNEYMTKENEGE